MCKLLSRNTVIWAFDLPSVGTMHGIDPSHPPVDTMDSYPSLRRLPQLPAGRPILLVPLLLALLPLPADAIPAFARRYGVSCALCHNPAPRLNGFGEQFAANGFRLVPGETTPGTLNTGDGLLSLPDHLPLALRLDAYVTALSGAGSGTSYTDLQAPWVVKLLSGGPISDRVSYYIYFMLSERGEVAGLEDAYLQFDDAAGTGITLLLGQFQVSDPMFKRELRLPYEDYQLYRLRVGDVAADLAYDRGVMALFSPREGTDLVLQVVNGRGLAEAGSERRYDRDRGKNVALHAAQELGFGRAGFFGYFGRERSDGLTSDLRVWGPDLSLTLGPRVELNVQALRRTDSNPFFLAACLPGDPRCGAGEAEPLRVTSNAFLAELIWAPRGDTGRWFVAGLFNHIDGDRAALRVRAGETAPVRRYQTLGGSVHYLLNRNVRWMGEVGWDPVNDRVRLTSGVSTAF